MVNYFLLAIVAIVGVALGYHLARHGRGTGALNRAQSKQKEENKESILTLFADRERIGNNDVEALLGVSDATATRYLDELEEEGKVRQIGTTGRGVKYTRI